MKILVTGPTGFVGRALIDSLLKNKYSVYAAVRNTSINGFNSDVNLVNIGHLTPSFDWSRDLQDMDVIIHLAARTHILNDQSNDPFSSYRYVNVECSLNLARQAAKVGVKRFIYLSSIKVNGEFTKLGQPFTAEDIPMPLDFYGVSKFEAELGLRKISEEFGMELVIIRPPLVYGPGVKANFLYIMRWLQLGIPIPLGGVIKNQRSFIFLDNLIDIIVTCINHPKAVNEIFLVSDDEDLSTAELLKRLSLALGQSSKLISIPTILISYGAKLAGRSDIAQRLCCSLQVDISKTKDFLNWQPQVSVDKGLLKTATYFLKNQN